MARFGRSIGLAAEDAASAWAGVGSTGLAGLKLAALPLAAVPLLGAAAIGAGSAGAFAVAVLVPAALACMLLSYGAHLSAQGLSSPPVLGVYSRPWFWTFVAAALVALVLQGVPTVLTLGFLGVAIMSLGVGDGAFPVATVLFLTGLVLTFWLYARLALLMPASAATGRVPLRDAWNASRGSVGRILVATFAVVLPIEIFDVVTRLVLGEAAGAILTVPAMLLQVVVVSATLSRIWMSAGRGDRSAVAGGRFIPQMSDLNDPRDKPSTTPG